MSSPSLGDWLPAKSGGAWNLKAQNLCFSVSPFLNLPAASSSFFSFPTWSTEQRDGTRD